MWAVPISSLNKNFFFIGLFFFSNCITAQKKSTQQTLIWYGFYVNANVGKNYEWFGEIQERHFIKPFAQHQLVIRNNIKYKLSKSWKLSGGFVVFLQSPNEPKSSSNLIIPELRPDLGFEVKHNFKKIEFSHRFKTEARFHHQTKNDELSGGFKFSNFRFRYQFGVDYPIYQFKNSKQSKLILRIRDEIMFNAGPAVEENTFDQNRIYGAINYKVSPKLSFELGYINWYQRRPKNNSYYDRDIIRFSVFQTLN